MLLNLPTEIICELKKYLNTEDVIKLRLTCKSLNMILEDVSVNYLLEYQRNHYYQMKNSLDKYRVCIDQSLMGSGKTYVACGLAREFHYPVLIICPKSVVLVWKQVTKELNLTNFTIVTYRKFIQFKKETSELREKIMKEAEEGIFVIFDECQNLKNETEQYNVALILFKLLRNKMYKMFLSATPIDQNEQCLRYIELLRTGNKLNFSDLDEIISKNDYHQNDNLLTFFIDNIMSKITFSMIPPPINAELVIFNGFYNISERGREVIERAICCIGRTIYELQQVHPIHTPKEYINGLWRKIDKSLSKIQEAKCEIIIRLTQKIIENNPNGKVIISFRFLKPIFSCCNALQDFNPLVLIGNKTESQRQNIIDKFQNDYRSRLLICNTSIASLGISLDDKIGNSPRTLLLAPTYHVMDSHQMSGRIYRSGTKSKATVIHVYAKRSGCNDMFLLNSISKKMNVMKKLLPQKLKEKVKFPTDYPIFEEEDLS